MVYGRALHAAVQAYHRPQMAGTPLSREELQAELDAAWESTGFLTRDHEEARRAAARDALDRFWDEQQAEPARPVAVEQEFAVRFGPDRVRGRYDRVDADADGRVTIADYKSGDVRDPATAASPLARVAPAGDLRPRPGRRSTAARPTSWRSTSWSRASVGHSAPTPKRLEKAAEPDRRRRATGSAPATSPPIRRRCAAATARSGDLP